MAERLGKDVRELLDWPANLLLEWMAYDYSLTDEFKEKCRTEEEKRKAKLKHAAMFKQLLNPLANGGKGTNTNGNNGKSSS